MSFVGNPLATSEILDVRPAISQCTLLRSCSQLRSLQKTEHLQARHPRARHSNCLRPQSKSHRTCQVLSETIHGGCYCHCVTCYSSGIFFHMSILGKHSLDLDFAALIVSFHSGRIALNTSNLVQPRPLQPLLGAQPILLLPPDPNILPKSMDSLPLAEFPSLWTLYVFHPCQTIYMHVNGHALRCY